MDYTLLNSLITLVIFSVICIANARWIIAFHRWCQYEVYEKDQRVIKNGRVRVLKAGQVVEDSKMILWKLKRWGDKNLGWLKKPVYDCPTCQASLHGIIPFLVTAKATGLFNTCDTWQLIIMGLFYIGVLSGVATELNER